MIATFALACLCVVVWTGAAMIRITADARRTRRALERIAGEPPRNRRIGQ